MAHEVDVGRIDADPILVGDGLFHVLLDSIAARFLPANSAFSGG
jgi:hypothetical protein